MSCVSIIFINFFLDFQKGLSIVRGLNVTNNAAERGVALIQSFNSSINTDVEQKQFLLQIKKLTKFEQLKIGTKF